MRKSRGLSVVDTRAPRSASKAHCPAFLPPIPTPTHVRPDGSHRRKDSSVGPAVSTLASFKIREMDACARRSPSTTTMRGCLLLLVSACLPHSRASREADVHQHSTRLKHGTSSSLDARLERVQRACGALCETAPDALTPAKSNAPFGTARAHVDCKALFDEPGMDAVREGVGPQAIPDRWRLAFTMNGRYPLRGRTNASELDDALAVAAGEPTKTRYDHSAWSRAYVDGLVAASKAGTFESGTTRFSGPASANYGIAAYAHAPGSHGASVLATVCVRALISPCGARALLLCTLVWVAQVQAASAHAQRRRHQRQARALVIG